MKMNKYEYKQVLILRKDLEMRKGKMIAQGAHASLKAILGSVNMGQGNCDPALKIHPYIEGWLMDRFAKIAVYVDSEEELLDIYKQAVNAELPCSLIEDAGFTEFNGVPTYTAVAVGPGPIDLIDTITKELKLL